MTELFTAKISARRQGAIGAFQTVKVDFRQVGSPRPLTEPERAAAAIIAANQFGWEVNHVVSVDLREEPIFQ